MASQLRSLSGSPAEDLFIELFTDTFGVEKAKFLYSPYQFYDIYENIRFADFVLDSYNKKIAIEIDDYATHHPSLVSKDKFCDDLLKQNSMVHLGWNVYRWPVSQMQKTPESVKDELKIFLGSDPKLKEIDDYLPCQQGRSLSYKNLELREYQQSALEALEELRKNNETIALLCHATGTGKTVTAVLDAKKCGGRVLCVAHTIELVGQSINTFRSLWSQVTVGRFDADSKEKNSHIVCGTVQSIALNLDLFKEDEFDYLIIDEAHHATAETYQKIISYFKPKFILGLTATPERTDNADILEIFKKTAHKLDLKKAVEIGALVPVRCIRIHTNIDMTKVRFNSIQYNNRDLDVKILLPSRNKVIVDTWVNFVKDKRTVVFCTSVKHAEAVASLFKERSIQAVAVSGSMKHSERNSVLENFKNGKINVLCACDLLNEGWDCPEVEVLFMARPTMSKMLYTQQLGRGMRKCKDKNHLMVFDFVDNFNNFNSSYSLHRLLNITHYRAGALVLADVEIRKIEEDLYRQGEKPEAIIDYPVNVKDYELVNVFNWQEEIQGLLSQIDFVRKVNIQSETIEAYIRNGKIVPDFIVPMSENRKFNYFKEENITKYAMRFGWQIIDDSNKKKIFLEMIEKMDMSYSYKPVFIKALLKCIDKKGQAKLNDIASEYSKFYEERRKKNIIVEKKRSIFAKGNYTEKEALANILSNPFKRFEDMNLMHHTKNIGVIEIDNVIWKKLTKDDLSKILKICDKKIIEYYEKIDVKESVEK